MTVLGGLANLKAPALRAMRVTCGLALILAACTGEARAHFGPGGHHAPELDPGSLSTGLALLAGGLLLLSDRYRRR